MSTTSLITTIAAAGNAGGGGDDPRLIYWTYDTAAKTVTYYQYHPTLGFEDSQTLSLSSSNSPTNYRAMAISWDGTKHAITEYIDSSSSSKTMRTFFIDFSGGVGNLSILGTFDFTGNYYLLYNGVSPEGNSFTFYHANNTTRVYDISSSYSSPTQVVSYGPSDYSYGPRGGRYTPQGRIVTYHGSDVGGVISQSNSSSVSFLTQSWTGWNQSTMSANYDGSYHFYAGSAVNANYFPYLHKFGSTSATNVNLGSNNSWTLRAQYCNMNEANDGNSYIAGARVISISGEWKGVSGYIIADYTTNTKVREVTTSTIYNGGFMPDGKFVELDISTSPYTVTVLDPDNSFADITSDYDSDYLAQVRDRSPANIWGSGTSSCYWWPNATYSGLNSIYP